MRKFALNGPFSISMLNYQRVVRWFPIKNLHVQWILPLKPSFQTRDYPASYVSLSEGKPPQNGQNGTVSGPWSFQACPSAIGRTSWGLSLGMFQFWRFRERRMRHTQLWYLPPCWDLPPFWDPEIPIDILIHGISWIFKITEQNTSVLFAHLK